MSLKYVAICFRRKLPRLLKCRLQELQELHSDAAKVFSTTAHTYGNAKMKSRPRLDYKYICDPQNSGYFEKLIYHRKGVGDIQKVLEIRKNMELSDPGSHEYITLEKDLEAEVLKIPNLASPHLWEYGEDPKVIEYVNRKPEFDFKPRTMEELCKELNTIRTENLGNLTGDHSYIFRGTLADLEQAVIKYSIAHLLSKGFTLMSVPDMLYSSIIEGCGMSTEGERTQVYKIAESEEDVCLAGTAEMSIAGYLRNRKFELESLPLKIAAVSRCYRAEVSHVSEEKGVYRVHDFAKVEMFGVTAAETGSESHELYSEMIQIQKDLFSQLGLHFQVLDMPLHELGAPAYTKTDMEAWMPGRNLFGEISSASNCTDYQSRRLNITYTDHQGHERLAHTVNGTACAVPRTLLATCETHQCENAVIALPPILQQYMTGIKEIISSSCPLQMAWIRPQAYEKLLLR